jgi:hypothetical protein
VDGCNSLCKNHYLIAKKLTAKKGCFTFYFYFCTNVSVFRSVFSCIRFMALNLAVTMNKYSLRHLSLQLEEVIQAD